MKYQFPEIKHINDVLPAIEGYPEFVVADREHYKVVNYIVSHPETFSGVETDYGAIRRECRGLIFDKDGYVIARRLHKFFNVNEKDETQMDQIDLSKPHVILEKLDGSMITPIPIGDHLRWGTKMGITDVAMNAEVFIQHHPQYTDFAWLCIERGQTPIFEWCSRKNKIVIDYPEDRLVLIAVRNNQTGLYWSFDQLKTYAESYNLDVVKSFPGTTESMQHLIDETRGSEGIEGWVIRFDDGHMVKVKGDWYVRIHKTKDDLQFEKNIISLIVHEQIDDAKSFMLEEDRQKVETFENKFWEGFNEIMFEINKNLMAIQVLKMDRKEFALKHAPHMNPLIRSIMFACWDGKKKVNDVALDIIKKNCGSSTKIEETRILWNFVKWDLVDNEIS